MTAIVIALAALGILNFLLNFALLARTRELQEVVETGVFRDPDLLAAGAKIGEFAATLNDGSRVTQADLAERCLVGFFTPGCKSCEQNQAALAAAPPAVPLLAFVEGSADDPEAAAIAQRLRGLGRVGYTKLGDPVATAFGANAFPTLVMTRHGKVTAAGRYLRQVM